MFSLPLFVHLFLLFSIVTVKTLTFHIDNNQWFFSLRSHCWLNAVVFAMYRLKSLCDLKHSHKLMSLAHWGSFFLELSFLKLISTFPFIETFLISPENQFRDKHLSIAGCYFDSLFYVSTFLLLQIGSGSPALWLWKSVKSPSSGDWCHFSSGGAAARRHNLDLLWRPRFSSPPPPPLLRGSPLLLLASTSWSFVTMSTAVEATGYLMVIISLVVTAISLVNDNWKISSVSGGVIVSYRESENLWHSCAENSAGIAECRDFESLLALPGKIFTHTHTLARQATWEANVKNCVFWSVFEFIEKFLLQSKLRVKPAVKQCHQVKFLF